MNDSDPGVAGGGQESLTVGLNGELNSMSRIMHNFLHAEFSSGVGADNGTVNSNLIRFQVDF